MSDHKFPISVAKDYDVETALLLEFLRFMTLHNKANKTKFHDGSYWVYNSYEAWTIHFPYWSAKQMRRILSNAEENGLIRVGNFNKREADLTKWYSLTDKSIEYFDELKEPKPNTPAQMGKPPAQMGKPPAQTGNALPDTNHDANPVVVVEQPTQQSQKEKAEQEALTDKDNIELFNKKFSNRDVTIEQIFKACQEYNAPKSRWVGSQLFNKWLHHENPENYNKKGSTASEKKSQNNFITSGDNALLQDYKAWLNGHSERVSLETWFPDASKREKAVELYNQEVAFLKAKHAQG